MLSRTPMWRIYSHPPKIELSVTQLNAYWMDVSVMSSFQCDGVLSSSSFAKLLYLNFRINKKVRLFCSMSDSHRCFIYVPQSATQVDISQKTSIWHLTHQWFWTRLSVVRQSASFFGSNLIWKHVSVSELSQGSTHVWNFWNFIGCGSFGVAFSVEVLVDFEVPGLGLQSLECVDVNICTEM